MERAVTARELVTQHNQVLKLERSYGVCPTCGAAAPLDEELALLPGALTPSLQEELAHLGAWVPVVAKAAALLQRLRGTSVSRPQRGRVLTKRRVRPMSLGRRQRSHAWNGKRRLRKASQAVHECGWGPGALGGR